MAMHIITPFIFVILLCLSTPLFFEFAAVLPDFQATSCSVAKHDGQGVTKSEYSMLCFFEKSICQSSAVKINQQFIFFFKGFAYMLWRFL